MTLVIAHRGASAYAPENTMPAFELALRQGADMLELDVLRTADGVLAVFHDDTTERWDGSQRLVASCTLAELQALNIGGARVATLAEVCVFARTHQMRLNVELKGEGFSADVAHMLETEGVANLVLVSSFSEMALHAFAAASPQIPRAFLIDTDAEPADDDLSWPFAALQRIGARAWHPSSELRQLHRLIPHVQAAGYAVNVWTVDNRQTMRALIAAGVDGIITNTPDVLRQMLAEV